MPRHDVEQLGERRAGDRRFVERRVRFQEVPVPPTLFHAREIARALQVVEPAEELTIARAERLRDLADRPIRMVRDADEHARMLGEESDAVSHWPQRWDVKGSDLYPSVSAWLP